MSETVALTTFAAADRDELRRALEDPSAGEAATQPARWRAAIAAESSEELGERAAELAALLDAGDPRPITGARGAFVGSCEARARVGFLFPGQGAPVQTAAGALGDLIPEAAAVYDLVDMPEQVPPQLVQLAVVTSSLS